MLGIVEALHSGSTTIVDDLSIGPVPNRKYLEAAHQAYEDAGIRAVVGISMMDRPFFESVPYIEEECPADLLAMLRQQQQPDADALLGLCRELATSRHPRHARVGFIVSPSAPHRCSERFLRAARALADEFDLPLMTHVQETRLQAVTAWQRYGCTMVEYLDRIGFLKPATSLIHGVWLTEREIEILAARGATVQHNPWSNLRLGSGLAPLRALLDAGVNVSLGSDGCSSTDTTNMLNVVGCTSVLHTLRGADNTRWPGAREAWKAGTVGGARALGLGDRLGGISPGKWADIVMYRTDSAHLMPLNDPLQQLSHAERGSGIDTVIVDGQVVVRNGRLSRIDEAAFAAELTESYEALRPQIAAAEASAAPLHPVMQRIHERCLRESIAQGVIPARFAD
jgi:guanine deaminase